MKALLFLLVFVLSSLPLCAQKGVSAGLSEIERTLTEITGLKFHKDVPFSVIDKTQLHRFLEEQMKSAIKPEDIHAEETTLKMLGFLPRDFDLKKATIDLLTEQAAAFYDYHKKKLFILQTPESTSDLHTEAEKMALSHELAHALADQQFKLDKYIREGARSDDDSTARLAVMEGQASWLMTAYLSKESTGQAAVPSGVLELMTHAIENNATEYPTFAKAPLYLRESLVFPYTIGTLFQNAIYEKMGKASFTEVFKRPPQSTQQIIHPEKYLDRVAPDVPTLPLIPNGKDYKKIDEGTLGEFDFRVMLEQYAGKDESRALSPHATGGMYELVEAKSDRHPVLALAAKWDSAESAAKFFDDYRKVLKGKSAGLSYEKETEHELSGHNEYGVFRVRVDGNRFESVEGLPTQVN